MSTDGMTPKPSRTPWIIAGVLGCLVVCLLILVVGGGAYVLLGQSQPTPVVRVVPTVGPLTAPTLPLVVVPTQPVAQPTVAQIVPPTLAPAVGQPGVISPTLAPAVAQPTVAPTATSKPAAPTGRLAFTIRRGDRPEDNSIWTMKADGIGATQVLTRSSEPSFSPDGTKIAFYQWRDGIFVANADGTDPKKVLGEGNSGFMSWSHDGRTIAVSTRPGNAGNIFIDAIPPDGSAVKDPSQRRNITVGESPFWSPDDTLLVFHTCRGSCGIYKVGAGGGDAIPIITDDGGLPAMSPDGKKIVYQKDADGQKQLFLINADGSGKQQLTSGASLHVSANWSPDGNFIFYRSPEGGQWGIWRMNADGSNPVKLANDMPPGDWPYDRIAVTK